jgi:hypothetical protein
MRTWIVRSLLRVEIWDTRHCEERSDEAIHPFTANGLLRYARNDDFMFGGLPPLNVHKARRALVDIGADRLKLIGTTHQFHLLDRFG